MDSRWTGDKSGSIRSNSLGGARAFVLMLLLFAPALLQAQSVTATLDRDTIALGERATLSIIFDGINPGGAPALPPIPGVSVAHAGQSSQFNFDGNRMVSTVSHNYVVTPAQEGEIRIPAFTLQFEGKTYSTQPLTLRVVKGEAGQAQNVATNHAFLRMIVPREEVYLGESFPVEIQLFFLNIRERSVQIPQINSDGFSFGELAQTGQSITQIGNRRFNVAVFKMAATAARTGTLTLGPAECRLTVLVPAPRNPRDPFGIFGSYQDVPTTLQSASATIRVLPLPLENKPADFNGAVGNYEMNVTAGPTNVAVGDPITVRVQIAGAGALNALSLPAQTGWDGFQIYSPTSQIERSDDIGLAGTKTFEQIVIPEKAGIEILPPFRFSFFDPAKKTYRTLASQPVPLNVHPSGTTPQPVVAATQVTGAETPPAQDIVHIKPRPGALAQIGPPLVLRPWFLAIQIVPALIWLAALTWRKRADALANNPRLRRRLEVDRLVQRGLRELNRHAAANQADAFFATVFRLLQERLGERLDLPASSITEAIIERLRPLRVPEATLARLHELFQACNLARYAPQITRHGLNALIPKVEQTLQELEDVRA